MIITPETLPVRVGIGPTATNGIADTCDWISLENADGALITIVHVGNTGGGGGSLVCTVHQGTTGAGTLAITTKQEFQIWINADCTASDTMVRQADGVTYSIVPAAVTQVVQFYIRASTLTQGYKWIQLGTAGGDASNTAAVIYQICGARYQQTTPPTDIA